MPTEPYALCPMPHALCPVVPHLSEKGYTNHTLLIPNSQYESASMPHAQCPIPYSLFPITND
ncbi:MAG: hypothetical protein WBL95_20490 [Microcoleus sp.]